MKRTFVLTDLEKNSNKYWTIDLQGTVVTTEYGRVGGKGAVENKNFGSAGEAQKYYDTKIRDKSKVKPGRRDTYTEITLVDVGSITHTTSPLKRSLRELALAEIETNSPSCKDLIGYLVDTNIHNITSSTTITYNIAEGCFRTPLGIVDKECIEQAKALLAKIEPYVLAEEYSSSDLLSLSNQYFRRIPQDLGGSHVRIHLKDVFRDLAKQYSIIEGLEAAVVTESPSSSTVKTFDSKIELLSSVPEKVSSLYKGSHGYKIKNTYSINIQSVLQSYNKYGSKIDNKHLLWHGTSPGNILSILKSGLVILPNATNGSRFGRGIYFSDRSSMSLSYASASQCNGKTTKFMFISEVALGKVYYGSGSSLSGDYHSRWAEKDSDTSQIIVYKNGQAQILYLVELTG